MVRTDKPHISTVFSSCSLSTASTVVWNSLDANTRSATTFVTFKYGRKTELFQKLCEHYGSVVASLASVRFAQGVFCITTHHASDDSV